jgi:predicted acetyltransferase
MLRRDANHLHMAAYRESIGRGQDYFDRCYNQNHLSLAQLATHPLFWRRGAATMLVDWGTALSEENGWPITVFAGPTAYSLYRKFGFKTVLKVSVMVAGETEKIEFPGMAWEPNGFEPQCRSGMPALYKLSVIYDENAAGNVA